MVRFLKLRFGIRFLLVGTAVAACWSWYFVEYVRKPRIAREWVIQNNGFMGEHDGTFTVQLYRGDFKDISPLGDLRDLEHLMLNQTQATDLRPIARLHKLKSLTIYDYNHDLDLAPLAGLSNLEKLHLRCDGTKDITPLSGLTNLRKLQLVGIPTNDLSFLSHLTRLEVLHVGSSRNVRDIKALSGLRNLRSLSVSSVSGIQDMSPLVGLELDSLRIEMTGIYDFTPLLKMKSLRRLELEPWVWGGDDRWPLASILTDLKTLSHLKVKAGLSPEQITLIRESLPDCTLDLK